VVEQKHGFNKSTVALFFQDKLITLALTFGLSLPILAIVVWLIRLGGEYFYFYVWLFLFFVSIILMTVYPTLIAPLFNKYMKLEEGEVKTAIEALAKKVSFPLTQVFQVDGSKRSAHSNAYFYGFFKNKVRLY
jgi:STE24 endopeptidase